MSERTLDEFDQAGDVYRATGPPDHWITTLNTGIWGFQPSDESSWERLDPGDVVVFHSVRNDTQDGTWPGGLIGYGVVGRKERKDYPLWRTEKLEAENQYPFIVYLTESHWRGEIDRVDPGDIDEKSLERIHADIDALLENRLEFTRIEEELDYNFPVMGSFSSFQNEAEILGMLRSGNLSHVFYRADPDHASDSPDGAGVLPEEDVQHIISPDSLRVAGEDIFDGLYFPEEERERIRNAVISAVRSGKHIIFTGPPGTGKTELAENLSRGLASANDQITGYQLATATADWSTFDTVGGYMPQEESGGTLEFKPGQVLKRLLNGSHARNELLIIDEINRADIDKAFGQLFTVLSGQGVQLPFEDGGREVEIMPSEDVDWSEGLGEHEYAVPESWRIIATMNSYDKTSLYEMSYAFMRRFTFVRVGPPASGEIEDEIGNYVDQWDVDPNEKDLEAVVDIWETMNTWGRPIGPALVRDMLGMMTSMDGGSINQKTTQAVVSYVLPQLEGVPDRDEIVNQLLASRFVDDTLRETAKEMLQVTLGDE